MYPLTYEEVVELSRRFKRYLPASYNMHAPQHLLASYLFHKEGQLCQACRYNYAGHAEGMTLANQQWGLTHSPNEVESHMSRYTVQVIVVKCAYKEGEGWQSYGDRICDTEFSSLEQARDFGEPARFGDLCVILRPKYNERDENGRFFREWRSFSGEEFKECRWEIGWDEETSCQPSSPCGCLPTPELDHSTHSESETP